MMEREPDGNVRSRENTGDGARRTGRVVEVREIGKGHL